MHLHYNLLSIQYNAEGFRDVHACTVKTDITGFCVCTRTQVLFMHYYTRIACELLEECITHFRYIKSCYCVSDSYVFIYIYIYVCTYIYKYIINRVEIDQQRL